MSEALTTTDLQQVAAFLDPTGVGELPDPDTCQRVGKWIGRAIAGGAEAAATGLGWKTPELTEEQWRHATHEARFGAVLDDFEAAVRTHALGLGDDIEAARSRLLAATPSAPARQAVRMLTVAPPEFQEASWGVNSVMRPCKSMAISEYAFRQWAKDVGIVLTDALPLEQQEGGK